MTHTDRRTFLSPRKRTAQRLMPFDSPETTEMPESLRARMALRAAAPPNSGLTPYAGPWTRAEAIHLIRRTMFGVTNADIDFFLSMSAEEAVDSLVYAPYTPPTPPVNDYNNPDFTDPDVPFGQTWINAAQNVGAEGYRIESLRGWWYRRMLGNERSLQEKMTLFWFNHIPVVFSDVFSGGHLYRYVKTLRDNALGNFKTMMKAVTLDPAMLYFLNGYLNSEQAPDENYAREIQELFVIGKDLPQHYTEEDVKEAARLLTGWRIGLDFGIYYNPTEHDTGSKQFSAFYNNKIIQGQGGFNGGEAELDEFLDMLFGHPEAAKYLCRKIYRFFVYHSIDAQTEQNIIVPLAEVFRNNNYDIKLVMSTLLKSEHFFDVLNRGAVIKSPVDFTTTMFNQLKVKLPGSADLLDTLYISFVVNGFMNDLLERPGDPPNVAGWPAYYQFPVFDKYWINTSTLPKRGQFSDILLFAGLYAINNVASANVLEYAASLSDPSDPDVIIAETHELLLGLPVPQQVYDLHRNILLTGLPQASYWTIAWQAYVANPTNAIIKGEVENRLKLFLRVVTQMEEYQLI